MLTELSPDDGRDNLDKSLVSTEPRRTVLGEWAAQTGASGPPSHIGGGGVLPYDQES